MHDFRLPKFDVGVALILLVGIVLQVSAVWFMGTPTAQGLFFCCRGVPDGIYHLALTDQLVRTIPPFEPGASGVVVRNYHYWSNLIMAETIRIFGTELITTVYKFFPLLISVLTAGAVVSLGSILKTGKNYTRLLALFVFFSGDSLFLLTALRGKGFLFNNQLLDDASKLLAGPPRSFSIMIFFWAIIAFVIWLKRFSWRGTIILTILFASLAGLKLYTAIFAYIGLGSTGLYFFAHRDWKRLSMPITVAILALAIYWPVNGGSNGISPVYPVAFRDFVSQPNLGIDVLRLRQMVFEASGKWPIVWGYELLFAILYFLFNFGVLNLAVFQTRQSLRRFPLILHWFLIPAILVTAYLGFFTSQKIGGGNTIQFIISLYFFLALYAALGISHLLDRLPKFLSVILFFIVIVLTVPRAVYEGLQNFQFVQRKEGFTVSDDQLAAMNYLRSTPANSVVMLSPDWANLETTLYVSFLSGRSIFLSGYKGVLSDHQTPGAEQRLEVNQSVFFKTNPQFVWTLIHSNNINYLYFPNEAKPRVGEIPWLSPKLVNQTVTVMWLPD